MLVVQNFVKLYFSNGFTNRKILNLLAQQHHIIISIRTFEKNSHKVC